ncbi:MAG: hypothetical protein HY855_25020 [Burkholderiales bacterium]|nr:hypothetical protein [Burkholderiales bacterium]
MGVRIVSRRSRIDYACAVEIQLPRWAARIRRFARALWHFITDPKGPL